MYEKSRALFEETASLYRQGASLGDLAKHYGITRQAIASRLDVVGCDRRLGGRPGFYISKERALELQKRHDDGETCTEIAADTGLNGSLVSKAIHRIGGTVHRRMHHHSGYASRRTSKRRSASIVKMYLDGRTIDYIKMHANTTTITIYRVLRRNDVPMRSPRARGVPSEEVDAVEVLHEKGFSAPEIAGKLSLTIGQVNHRRYLFRVRRADHAMPGV